MKKKVENPVYKKVKIEDSEINHEDRFFKTVLDIEAEDKRKVKVKVRCTIL